LRKDGRIDCASSIIFVCGSAFGIDIESEHILTVCDTFNILRTRKGEPMPNYFSLPPPTDGFFSQNLKSGSQFDSGCAELDAKNVTSSDETVDQVVVMAGGVATLKWIADIQLNPKWSIL
jgi:hypothetical protein